MANGNYIDRTQPPVERPAHTEAGRYWPTTRDGIQEERSRRMAASLGLAYSDAEIRRMNLFKALDASGQLIAETRRVLPLIRFVVGVDAAALWTQGVTWSVATARLGEAPSEDRVKALAALGSAVWTRSKMKTAGPALAWNLCATGDWCVEVVKSPAGAVLVPHSPRRVHVEKDPLGLTITRAVIDVDYTDSPIPDPETGKYNGGGKDHTYRRVLTPERIDVYIDGARQVNESGTNTLGVVPLVWMRFRQVGEFELSSWAGDGAEDAVAMIDSMLTQIQVVGGRNANPLLVATGAQIAEGAELTQVGRTASLPVGGDLKWLEATLNGLRELGGAAGQLYDQITQAYPEFLFVEAGASASGTALSYRAGAFVAKVAPVRSAFYDAMSEALGMAVALDAGQRWTPEADVYAVDGGSALPQDVSAIADLLTGLVAAGLARPQDVIARLQSERLLPDDLEPADYLAQAQIAAADREAGQLRTAMQVAEAARAMENAVGREEPDEETQDAPDQSDQTTDPMTAPADPSAPAADALADTALNGAQVEAAVGIVEKVALGQLPRESGIAMLVDFFQLDAARAERVIGSVGRGFTPDTVTESAPSVARPSENTPQP